MNLLSRLAAGALAVGLLLLVLATVSVLSGQGDEERALLIPRGASAGQIGRQLEAEGVISSPGLFKALVYLTGGQRRIKAGEYRFRTDMNPASALSVLYFSEPVVHPITVPEGWNARQIADILAAKKLVDPKKFLSIVLNKASAEKYKLGAPTLEGFLYPDTYTFSRIDGEAKIVDRMVQRFFSKVDKEVIARAKAMGLSLEQLVTLASIIEKETGVPTERELISSVFHNRLKKKMRLQSDPTTIYGIAGFDGNLTRKHLLTSTPYNTYTIAALPPGAICSPGIAAIRATTQPAQTDYLYFVANNQGAHLFAPTYKEHAANVDFYQKRRASRKANSIPEKRMDRQIGTLKR